MYLFEGVKFDYPKLIADSMHEKFSNFNTLSAFKYQAYLMYMILDKFSLDFHFLMEPEDPTPYEIISVIHRSSFIKNEAQNFSKFVNSFTCQVYLLLFETPYPRVSQELQECLHPPIEDYVGDGFYLKTILL